MCIWNWDYMLKWDQSAKLSPFVSIRVQQLSTTNKLDKLDLIGVQFCQVSKQNKKNTGARKLKGVCNGLTTKWTTKSKLRKEEDIDASQSMSYTPKWSVNSTRKTVSSMLCIPHQRALLCKPVLIKEYLTPPFPNSEWHELIKNFY